MKSLLTILLICFCFVGYGQVHADTSNTAKGVRINDIDSLRSLLSEYSAGSSITLRTIPTPKYDTVKVIIVVCDTSTIRIIDYSIVNGSFDTSYRSRIRTQNVWWQYGYEVKEYRQINGYGSFPSHKEFLDENKKHLSKNIFIWECRALSQKDSYSLINSTISF